MYYRKSRKKESKEDFAGMGVSFKVRAVPELRQKSVGNSQASFYSVPPNLQSVIAPRFSGTASYGPYLNLQMPSMHEQAVPAFPLTQTNDVRAFDARTNSINGVSEGFENVQPNFTSGNYQEVRDDLPFRSNIAENGLLQQVQDIATAGTNGSDLVSQPIVYDRFIYANQRSRLYGRGDPIRGDIPIVPYNGDWFRPSVSPNIDLRDGAMSVMAGENNETARQTMALMRASSGNTMNTFAGAPVMSDQKKLSTSAGGADVYATAFP